MSNHELAELSERVKALEAVIFTLRCTCMFWTASIPPMQQSDGTCPVHPVRGLWRDGQPPKVDPQPTGFITLTETP